MGKSTISMVMFNSYVTNYQRVWSFLFLITVWFWDFTQQLRISLTKNRDLWLIRSIKNYSCICVFFCQRSKKYPFPKQGLNWKPKPKKQPLTIPFLEWPSLQEPESRSSSTTLREEHFKMVGRSDHRQKSELDYTHTYIYIFIYLSIYLFIYINHKITCIKETHFYHLLSPLY